MGLLIYFLLLSALRTSEVKKGHGAYTKLGRHPKNTHEFPQ